MSNRFVQDLLAQRWVEIARAGTFHASTGKVTITQEHLQEMADDYNPEERVASLVIGHPSMLQVEGERKAHGVVAGLRVLGNSLQARFKNLSDEVREGLRAGHWLNRSIEASLKSRETERAYLYALALLGGSQPAIPAMLSADDDGKITITTEIDKIETNQPPNDKGASDMEDSKVMAAIEAAVKPLEAEIAELSARPNVSVAEFAAMKEQVDKVDALLEENKTLKASFATLEDKQAADAVALATKGIPAAMCSDEEKAYLCKVYKQDQAAFAMLTAKFDPMRKKFAYLTVPLETTRLSDGGDAAVINPQKGADAATSEIAATAAELRAKDKNLSIEQSIKLAAKEVSQ